MLCDELKAYKGDVTIPVYGTIADAEVYLKDKADKAIEELKAKLETVQATAYADSVDAGMRERRLKRALWLARSYRGRDNSILLPSKFMRNVWDNVERKCRAKAEEYK